VLHGGTGISEEQFRAAIASGISKINVATDLFVAAGKCLVEVAKTDHNSYFALSKAATESFRERCGYYMELFGAAGKA
jgi:fructose-bisphosphate aldolase class II